MIAHPVGWHRGCIHSHARSDLTCAGWLRRGSHTFLTPTVSMKAAKQGKADEMRATCVVIHNLISRRNAVAVLDDQYEGLNGDDKARVDAQCRAVYSEEQLQRCPDGQIMDQGLRLAAAEHLGFDRHRRGAPEPFLHFAPLGHFDQLDHFLQCNLKHGGPFRVGLSL